MYHYEFAHKFWSVNRLKRTLVLLYAVEQITLQVESWRRWLKNNWPKSNKSNLAKKKLTKYKKKKTNCQKLVRLNGQKGQKQNWESLKNKKKLVKRGKNQTPLKNPKHRPAWIQNCIQKKVKYPKKYRQTKLKKNWKKTGEQKKMIKH